MKTNVKKHQDKQDGKKQVNITWNSRLGFQIGIVVSCLIIFYIMQISVETGKSQTKVASGFWLEEPAIVDYTLDVEQPEPIASVKRDPVKTVPMPKLKKSSNFTVINNLDEESVIPPEIAMTDAPSLPEPNSLRPSEPASIINVEFVPVYPGCENLNSNAEKIDCLSSQISLFINKNFRKELLENLERNQTQKIYVQFKIDSEGFIKDVRANSHNERLKKEAKRVVANLPKMKPGRQGNKNVDVLYTVPIVFRVQ